MHLVKKEKIINFVIDFINHVKKKYRNNDIHKIGNRFYYQMMKFYHLYKRIIYLQKNLIINYKLV